MNHFPIFSKEPDVQWVSGYMTAANTTADLTSGTTYLVFTAGAKGGFLRQIDFKATPAGNTTLTVARIWINNGTTPSGGASNQVLWAEITLPATTASANGETVGYTKPCNLPLPAGYKIYITLGTASSNGWSATAIGGKY